VKSGGTSHTMRCGMCIEIGKEQIPADLRNDDRNVAFHARHITGRRAEADEACWVLYVHVAQIPSAAGDLLEELMSGPKIRMRAEPVIHRILETGGFTVIMKPAQYETLARKTEQISRTIGLERTLCRSQRCAARSVAMCTAEATCCQIALGWIQRASWARPATGAIVAGNSPVTSIRRDGGDFTETRPRALVSAANVVVATNGCTGSVIEQPIEGFTVHLLDGAAAESRGVVHQDVELPAGGSGLINHGTGCFMVCDTNLAEDRLAAIGIDQAQGFLAMCGRTGSDHDNGAFAREGDGDSAADAPARSGDNGDFSSETGAHGMSSVSASVYDHDASGAAGEKQR
jgi:hypothetical protein